MRRLALWLGGFFLFFLFAMRLAAWQTEAWWFDEAGYRFVFSKANAVRGLLFIAGAASMFSLLWLNWRRIPFLSFNTFPASLGVGKTGFPSARQLQGAALVVALGLALACGIWASSMWSTALLFTAGQAVGEADPVFKLDLGFWLFRLPFWQFLYTFVSLGLWLALLGAALLYELGHDIALGERPHRLSPPALRHLVKLGIAILIVKIFGLRLYALGLLTSQHGLVWGAGYADIHARLPLAVIAGGVNILAAVLLWRAGRNGQRRKVRKVLLGYVVASLVTGVVLPGVVQRWRVVPAELQLEAPYIDRMMAASRRAYAVDRVAAEPVTPLSSAAPLVRAAHGLPVWPPEALRKIANTPGSESLGAAPAFIAGELRLDRYFINGEWRLVYAGVRDAQPGPAARNSQPPTGNIWERRHLDDIYGHGLVLADASRATENGAPVFYTQQMGALQNQVYFGLFPETPPSIGPRNDIPLAERALSGSSMAEPFADFVVANARSKSGLAVSRPLYPAGIALDSAWRRWLIALRFGDWQLATNSRIAPESRAIWYRRTVERCRRIAPFLEFPADPYPVAVNGRIVWLADGFTASRTYPYSRPDKPYTSQRNYYRNPVKATVDAFDGSVKFYVCDSTDPFIRTWQRVFPGLFLSLEEMPAELRRHSQYPPALLDAQSATWAHFRADDAAAYYAGRTRGEALPASLALLPTSPDSKTAPRYTTIAPLVAPSSAGGAGAATITGLLLADSDYLQAGSVSAPLLREWRPANLNASLQDVDGDIESAPGVRDAREQDANERRPQVRSALAFAPVGDRLLVARGITRGWNSESAWLTETTRPGEATGHLDKVAFWRGRAWAGDSLEETLARMLHDLRKEFPKGAAEGAATPWLDEPPAQILKLVRKQFRRMQEARAAGDWVAYEAAEAEMRRLLGGAG